MLSIDPASKSMGVACYKEGKELFCKTIKAKPTDPVGLRLFKLFNLIRSSLKEHGLTTVDIALVEKVRSSSGHIFLVWSAGIAVAVSNSPYTVEIPSYMWKKCVDDDYYKDDHMDARYMAKLALILCEEDQ